MSTLLKDSVKYTILDSETEQEEAMKWLKEHFPIEWFGRIAWKLVPGSQLICNGITETLGREITQAVNTLIGKNGSDAPRTVIISWYNANDPMLTVPFSALEMHATEAAWCDQCWIFSPDEGWCAERDNHYRVHLGRAQYPCPQPDAPKSIKKYLREPRS